LPGSRVQFDTPSTNGSLQTLLTAPFQTNRPLDGRRFRSSDRSEPPRVNVWPIGIAPK
jgi:hypothetical protein